MTKTGASGGVYEPGEVDEPKRHCFAVLVANEPGVLARVVGLFSGRGYNIESLTVDEVNADDHFSRMTIVTRGTRSTIDQIAAQLLRLVPVRQVINLTQQGRSVETCIALVKVVTDVNKHDQAKDIGRKYAARVADTTDHAVIFELASDSQKIERFAAELSAIGAIEIARAGSVAIGCGDAMLGASPDLAHCHSP